jgi:ADP-heptose:LPS heptosyltransferase/predicted SAM-dependent methyltransferase
MTWRSDAPQGGESVKIAFELVEYMHGRVLDLGCGPAKVLPAPNIIGVDDNTDAKLFGIQAKPNLFADCAKLDVFTDASADTVFSSHLLEHVVDYKAALREWWRVLKPGGYLILYLPHKDHYPNIGMPHANPDHKHDFRNEDITAAMQEIAWRTPYGWDQLRDEIRIGSDEYSFLQIYRKRSDKQTNLNEPKEKPAKSIGIVRLGAHGDALWVSSILPALKAQGYHITVYTQSQGEASLRHDPNIDHLSVQPHQIFGNGPDTMDIQIAYWQQCEMRHDRFINLVGCVEQSLLPNQQHPNFFLPADQRRALMGRKSYLQAVHEWADLPFDPDTARVRFYPSPEEMSFAIAERAKIDGPLVVINPSGSSPTKFWPHVQKAIDLFGDEGVNVMVLGDLRGMQYAGKRAKIIGTSWTIRQAYTMASLADVVIGTESAIVNSVSHETPLKIVLLSHSSPANLTANWTNTVAVHPDGLACYPCHRIHSDLKYCTVNAETKTAACQAAVSGEDVVGYAMQWIRGEMKEAA